jgi:hypothetical protein
MTRRRFTFWLSFGVVTLAEKLGLHGIDSLAAAAMDGADAPASKRARSLPVHWSAAEDDDWRWYEREHFIDGEWWLTGTTAPVHKKTAERKHDGNEAYLDDRLLPSSMRVSLQQFPTNATPIESAVPDRQLPTARRRRQHGRPPSKWLRSLNADELRIWLKTIECPEAGVEGMTYWTHLTRDHFFDPERIVGLSDAEQAKLHGAAHFGF